MPDPQSRIRLNHLMYVRYRHEDLTLANQFLEDFGLVPVAKDETKILYRGFGRDPVSYIAEQAPNGKKVLLGGGWAVDSLEDLELAATLPNASSITETNTAIGGKYVTIQDPVGMHIFLHWGYHERAPQPTEMPKPMSYNTWEKKRRLGEFQRLPDGPSYIHKLGHYGFEVNQSRFEDVRSWYLDNFALAKTDTLFNPKTGEDVMQFMHLDRGEEYVDHHTFFITAGDVGEGYKPHHSSFEVDDFDSEMRGHLWLEKKGYSLAWGIGRHILGSQVFDYWFDNSGFVVEHYADGDLINCNHKQERVPASADAVSIWGPDLPLAFMTRNVNDVGKTLGAG